VARGGFAQPAGQLHSEQRKRQPLTPARQGKERDRTDGGDSRNKTADEEGAETELGRDQPAADERREAGGTSRYWRTPSKKSRGARAFSSPANRHTAPRPVRHTKYVTTDAKKLPL
jgi:hypothetical protein